MTPTKIEIPYNGQSFFIDIADGNMVSLTRIYEISGQLLGKHDPKRWKEKAGKDFIEFIASNLNVPIGDIYKTRRGKHGGGSWAHWQIALAYANSKAPKKIESNPIDREAAKEKIESMRKALRGA